jgi:hypothetical protein
MEMEMQVWLLVMGNLLLLTTLVLLVAGPALVREVKLTAQALPRLRKARRERKVNQLLTQALMELQLLQDQMREVHLQQMPAPLPRPHLPVPTRYSTASTRS